MRYYLILIICLVPTLAWTQPKPVDNKSSVETRGNNNIIKVIQAGTVISYNLTKDQDVQNLLIYLRNIPLLFTHLNELNKEVKHINQQGINNNKLLIAIAKNTSYNGFISLKAYNESLEQYITENNRLKVEIDQYKKVNQDSEFLAILVQAENKLKQLDNEGYQELLENFKTKLKAKLQKQQSEIAQTSYLQAQNSASNYQYEKALKQVNEALTFQASPRYTIFKGKVLRTLYRNDEAIVTFLQVDSTSLEDTLKASLYHELAKTYHTKKNNDKAFIYAVKAFSTEATLFGPKHPFLVNSYSGLGAAYTMYKGDYNQAIDAYTEALTIAIHAYGIKHENVASSYFLLSSAYIMKGDYNKAIDYATKSLATYLDLYGPNYLNVSMVYGLLGQIYYRQDDNDKALSFYTKSLDIQLKALGDQHTDLRETYDTMGLIYEKKDDYVKAIENYSKSLYINIKVFKSKHINTAISYNKLGMAYDNNGDFDKAIDCYSKALLIQLDVLGNQDKDVGSTYNNIGVAYYNSGDYSKAIDNYIKAIDVYSKIFEESHFIRLNPVQNICEAFIANNQLQQCIIYLDKNQSFRSLSVRQKSMYFSAVGKNLLDEEKYQLAIITFNYALSLLDTLNPLPNDEVWALIYQNAATAYCLKGDKKMAKGYFEKAINYSQQLTDKEINKHIRSNFEDCVKH